jgi:hypothetical protein
MLLFSPLTIARPLMLQYKKESIGPIWTSGKEYPGMEQSTVTLELPSNLYTDLKEMATNEQTSITDLLMRLVAESQKPQTDPVFELIGAYRSTMPLIDNIPVSEDPELYAIAESLGEATHTLHAWEIAPQRYAQGADNQAIRRDDGAGE